MDPGKRKGVLVAKTALTHILLAAGTLVIAFPFLWMLTNSIKTKDEIWAVPPHLLPAVPQWNNYADALADGSFFRYIGNSAYTSLIITVIILVNSAMFAYAITNIQFRGRNFLFLLVMATYIMPPNVTHVPGYVILARMGLMGTHAGYILSCAASVFNIFFFRQKFLQIDRAIFEAARVDGAGHRVILWRIAAPMSGSAFATLGILSFVQSYNSYVWPSLIIKDKTKFFVSMGIRAFFSAEGGYGLKWGSIMASCCVIILPLLLIFFIGERWIISGITSDTAVKG